MCPEIVDNPHSDCDSPCKCINHTSYAKPKVKWTSRNNNEPVALPTYKTTTSKYHTRCLPSTPKSNIKRIPAPKPYIISNAMYAEFLGPDTDYNKNASVCRHPAPSLLLPCQPLHSPSKKTTINQNKSSNKESVSLYNLDTLRKAKALLDYSPESEFLKRLKKEAEETFHCQCAECKLENEMSKLQLTRSRRLLEEYYDGSKKNNLNELFRKVPMCCKYAQLTFPDYKFKPSRFGGVPQDLQKYSIKEDDKFIHRIRHIREENFFDCHSTAFLDRQQIPPHYCDHKFVADDRLLPKPLNSDPYGISRCRVCNEPMKSVPAYMRHLPSNTQNREYIPDQTKKVPSNTDKQISSPDKRANSGVKMSNVEIKKPNPKITQCSPEVKNSKSEIKKSDSNNNNLPEQHPLDASPTSVCVDDSLTDELKKFNRLIRSRAIHITPRKINFPSRSVLKQLINSPDLNGKSKIDKKKTVAAKNSWVPQYQKKN